MSFCSILLILNEVLLIKLPGNLSVVYIENKNGGRIVSVLCAYMSPMAVSVFQQQMSKCDRKDNCAYLIQLPERKQATNHVIGDRFLLRNPEQVWVSLQGSAKLPHHSPSPTVSPTRSLQSKYENYTVLWSIVGFQNTHNSDFPKVLCTTFS